MNLLTTYRHFGLFLARALPNSPRIVNSLYFDMYVAFFGIFYRLMILLTCQLFFLHLTTDCENLLVARVCRNCSRLMVSSTFMTSFRFSPLLLRSMRGVI